MTITLPELAYLSSKASYRWDLGDTSSAGFLSLLRKSWVPLQENDAFRAAARLLKELTRETAPEGLERRRRFRLAFSLAAYRLFLSKARLTVTRQDLRLLSDRLGEMPEEALAAWFTKRSVSLHLPSPGDRGAGGRDADLIVKGLISRDGQGPPVIHAAEGRCHLLLADTPPGVDDAVTAGPGTNPVRVPPAASGFEDLSVARNRDLVAGLSGGGVAERLRKWLKLAGLDKREDSPFGRLPPGRKFLWRLSLAAALHPARPMIIGKPALEPAEDAAFWHLAAALAAGAPYFLVISSRPADLAQAHRASIAWGGRLLGTLGRDDLDFLPDFLWAGGRILSPGPAALWPAHWLKTVSATGEMFFAVNRERLADDTYRASLRRGYGIVLNERFHPSTLEERAVKELCDRSPGAVVPKPC